MCHCPDPLTAFEEPYCTVNDLARARKIRCTGMCYPCAREAACVAAPRYCFRSALAAARTRMVWYVLNSGAWLSYPRLLPKESLVASAPI